MTATSPLGFTCVDCSPGRPCTFCLSALAERRRDATPMAPPIAKEQEFEPKPEPRQDGPGIDNNYDYEAGHYRVVPRGWRVK